MTRPLGAFLALVIFAALAGPLDWRNWLLGLPLAGLLALAFASGDSRLRGLPAYILSGGWGIVVGTARMLGLMLRRNPWSRHGYVLRRPKDNSRTGLARFALHETASPGTIVAGLDPVSGEAVLHDIDASGQTPAPPPPHPHPKEGTA